MTEFAVILDDVSVILGGRVILDNLNVSIEKGVLTAVMGPNGAGKTTLLHAILGLLPYRGNIYFGQAGNTKRPAIGYVPQRLDLDRGSPITVRDFLCAVLTHRPLWFSVGRRTEQRALAVLERLGISAIFHSPMGKLSGGETQRVLLAQALLADPVILLLDEPAAAVDIAGEALFCDILDEVSREAAITTLLVSHDLSVVTTHARNVLCLNKNVICHGPVAQVMTDDNLKRVFSPHANVFTHSHTHPNPTKSGEPHGHPD
jgi:zinc transport system ATP-binding protein